MRFNPNKLRLWLPVLTGTFAAVFLVCCDQLGGKIHPAATANTLVQAPAPAPAIPAKAPAEAPKIASESPSAPVAELRTAEAPAPARPSTTRHSSIRKFRRTQAVPTVEESVPATATASSVQDSALPMVAATPLPASTPEPLAASDSLAPVADAKAAVDSAALPTTATEAKDSTFAVPAQAPASEKSALPTAQETPLQSNDPGRTSMLLPEEIRQ